MVVYALFADSNYLLEGVYAANNNKTPLVPKMAFQNVVPNSCVFETMAKKPKSSLFTLHYVAILLSFIAHAFNNVPSLAFNHLRHFNDPTL